MGYRQVLVASFKGGTGKTTVTAALARQLPGRIACLDMDWNNAVLNLALEIAPAVHLPLRNFRIAPVEWERGQFASIGFLTIPGGILRQNPEHREALVVDFVSSLAWEEFDWLLIDTGPVGEELTPIIKAIDPEVIVLGEGGELSQAGVVRTVLFLTAVKAKVLGLLANKGWDGRTLAGELMIPYLGSIPLVRDPRGIATPDLTQHRAQRLGDPTLADKAKRWLVKQGLEVILKEER